MPPRRGKRKGKGTAQGAACPEEASSQALAEETGSPDAPPPANESSAVDIMTSLGSTSKSLDAPEPSAENMEALRSENAALKARVAALEAQVRYLSCQSQLVALYRCHQGHLARAAEREAPLQRQNARGSWKAQPPAETHQRHARVVLPPGADSSKTCVRFCSMQAVTAKTDREATGNENSSASKPGVCNCQLHARSSCIASCICMRSLVPYLRVPAGGDGKGRDRKL